MRLRKEERGEVFTTLLDWVFSGVHGLMGAGLHRS